MHRASVLQRRLQSTANEQSSLLSFLSSIPTSNLKHNAIQAHRFTAEHKRINRTKPAYTFPIPTLAHLHTSLSQHSPKQAWAIYKHLATTPASSHANEAPNQLDQIDAETHSQLLQQTTRFPIYMDAAMKAEKIVKNIASQSTFNEHPLDARDILALLKINYRNDNDTARVLQTFALSRLPTTAHYTVLILSLGQQGLLESAVFYYKKMYTGNKGARFDTDAIAALIDAFGYAGQVDGGIEVFGCYLDEIKDALEDTREPTVLIRMIMRADVGVYEAMIRCYARCGYLDDAIDLFTTLTNGDVENVVVEKTTFDAILVGVACSGTFDECKQYRALMHEWCIDQTLEINDINTSTSSEVNSSGAVTTYTQQDHRRQRTAYKSYSRESLLSLYHSNHPEPLDLSFSFFHKGQGENLSTHIEFPLMHTFESMLKCAVRHFGSDGGATVEDMMEIFFSCQRGYSIPSQGVYEAVIEAFEVAGLNDRAEEWRQGIKSKGYKLKDNIE